MTALHTVKTATEENDNGDGGEKEKKKWIETTITWQTWPLSILVSFWTAADANGKCWQTRRRSRLCLDTPAKSSCFLEVISDQMWLRSAPCVQRGAQSSIKSCFFFWFVFQTLPLRQTRVYGVWKCSLISDYIEEEATAGVSRVWGPLTMHHRGREGHRNTKPRYTHSPMAGGLLQNSAICCSSDENGAKVPR